MDDDALTNPPIGATDLERAQADRIRQLVVDRDRWRELTVARTRRRQQAGALLLILMAAAVSGLLAWLATNVNDRAQANVPRQTAILCLTARVSLTTDAVNDLLDHSRDVDYQHRRIEQLDRDRKATLYVHLPHLAKDVPCPSGALVSTTPPPSKP